MDGSLGQILDVNHVCALRDVSCGQYCDYACVQLRREFGAPQGRLSSSLPTVEFLHLHLFCLLLRAVPNRNPSLHERFAEVKSATIAFVPESFQSFLGVSSSARDCRSSYAQAHID